MARDDYKRQKNAKQHGGVIRHVVGLFASFICGFLVANVVDLPSSIAWINQHWVNLQTMADGKQTGAQNNGMQTVAATTTPAQSAETPKPKFEFYTLLSKDNKAPVAAIREVALSQQDHAPATLPGNVNQDPAQSLTESLRPTTAESDSQKNIATEEQTTNISTSTNQVNTTNTNSRSVVPVAESQPIAPIAAPTAKALVKKETYMIQIAAVTRRQDADRLKASLTRKGYGVMIVSPTDSKTNWYRVVIGPFHSRAEAEQAQLNVARTEHIHGMIRKLDV